MKQKLVSGPAPLHHSIHTHKLVLKIPFSISHPHHLHSQSMFHQLEKTCSISFHLCFPFYVHLIACIPLPSVCRFCNQVRGGWWRATSCNRPQNVQIMTCLLTLDTVTSGTFKCLYFLSLKTCFWVSLTRGWLGYCLNISTNFGGGQTWTVE